MPDVRITYSRDKAAAAARLMEAIAGAGYAVRSDEIAELEDLFDPDHGHRSGDATLLIWSRTLLSSALHSGLLRQVRQERNLIEVSADGVGPQAPEGDNRVVMISGWRGQPFHPGWQRIADELKRICGSGSGVPEPPARAEPVLPRAAAADASVAEPRKDIRRLPIARLSLALLAAAGLFGAGFATATWVGTEGSGSQGAQATSAPIVEERSGAPADARQPGLVVPPMTRPVPLTAQAPAVAAAPASGTDASPGSPASEASSSPKRNRNGAERRKSERADNDRPAKASSAADKRYSRRNSKVMREFCEGAGSGTPQCRTFLRSTQQSRR